MSRRKRKQKPLFKKRYTSTQITLRVLLTLFILAVVAFVGISVAKPLVEYFGNGTHNTPSEKVPAVTDSHEAPETTSDTTQATSPSTEITTESTTATEPPVVKQGIFYFAFPENGDITSNTQSLTDAVALAKKENYFGFCVELISKGGKIHYTTQNKLANDSEAVTVGALALADVTAYITESELVPYARISALSDNIASLRSREICYLFEGQTTKWLDNSLSNGGKPWISPFRDGAKDYISSLVTEITDAGFAGLISGELEFPHFYKNDLVYVGKIVQSPTRYTALCEFSNLLSDTFGSAKEYAAEVSAYELLTGECELLSEPDLLNVKTVYVKYSSQELGIRINRADGSAVSFEGLFEAQKLAQVYRLVNTQLANSGLKVIPAVDAELSKDEIISSLSDIGFKPEQILIY